MTYAMTYLGAALMAYNIYRYIRFSRDAGVREDLKQETRILNLPILLLVLFLCGYLATRTIRALDDPARAGVPIVAMTADAFLEDQKKAYDAGMQGHIAKPIDMKQMLDTLKSVLGR